MYDYSFVGQILSRRDEPEPRYTEQEIQHVMWCPMSLGEALAAGSCRKQLLVAWLLNRLPAALAVRMMSLVNRVPKR